MGGLHWWRKRRPRAAVIIALLVVSHWVLDFATHRPDMPLTPVEPGQARAGTLELRDRNGRRGERDVRGRCVVVPVRPRGREMASAATGWRALVALLVVIYLGAAFGPPPPSAQAIAVSMLPALAIAFWAAWADRHRAWKPIQPR